MPKPTLLVTRRLPEAVLERVEKDYQAEINTGPSALSMAEIQAQAAGKEGILVCPTDKVDEALILSLPESVKMIATFSVGYEHIDLNAAKARGIVVSNTPDVLTDCTADIALLLMLAAARRAHEGNAYARSGDWDGWKPTHMLGIEVTGKRLGIFGMGRIGQAVAKRARAFDMTIHYHNRSRLPAELEQGAIYHDSPQGLLGFSDFLSLHCPATPETVKFLNEEHINMLPEGAIVVNTSRGGVVDDEALIAALKSGRVAAAGLDVFEGEPNLNKGYVDLPNTFLLPHVGSATVETRNAMGFRALDNLDAFFAGQDPKDKLV